MKISESERGRGEKQKERKFKKIKKGTKVFLSLSFAFLHNSIIKKEHKHTYEAAAEGRKILNLPPNCFRIHKSCDSL
jgi:hypothetical protein